MGLVKFFGKILYLVKMLALIGLSISGAALMGLYSFQNLLIYPASMNDGHGYCARPEEFGMPDYEDLHLDTEDGEVLHCYCLKQDHSLPEYTNKTVLILSPNAGNIGHALPIVSMFYKNFGYNVFIYSYRGYGKSTGKPSEEGLRLDAQTVMKHISKDEQLLQTSLILYGRSLGGAVSIYISSLMPNNVQGLILENTFLSIPKTVPHIFPFLKYFTVFVHQKWELERLMPSIPANIPVLFFSARKDEIVPPSHMDKLYELSQSNDKTFFKYPNSQHNDTVVQPDYWERVHEFIKNKVNPVGY
uniref:Serine aminopeptidase S33 domain-containing protein n=1 Tax=Candidozyma auris TaxID=498019 RepID=A0A0L0NXE0_CANAR